jgi:sRNA-binding carbon storage regulator CsrA
MAFLTDLTPDDSVELEAGEHKIRLKVIKRTGQKVRLSIDAGREVKILKIDGTKKEKD